MLYKFMLGIQNKKQEKFDINIMMNSLYEILTLHGILGMNLRRMD